VNHSALRAPILKRAEMRELDVESPLVVLSGFRGVLLRFELDYSQYALELVVRALDCGQPPAHRRFPRKIPCGREHPGLHGNQPFSDTQEIDDPRTAPP
jgi:hypothetical protein